MLTLLGDPPANWPRGLIPKTLDADHVETYTRFEAAHERFIEARRSAFASYVAHLNESTLSINAIEHLFEQTPDSTSSTSGSADSMPMERTDLKSRITQNPGSKETQEDGVAHHENPLKFVSLGMIIIDDIYQPGRAPVVDKLGGAGTYATMGARIFFPKVHADLRQRPVGFVVHAGSDFPSLVRTELESWCTGSLMMETPHRLTTRGKNVYREEVRDFAFLSPKIQVDATMLNPGMLTSKTYHLICEPSRCQSLVAGILTKRKDILERNLHLGDTFIKPIFVWEVMEGSCRPSELSSFYETLKVIDVFSPNEHELGMLFSESNSEANEPMPVELLHRRCRQLLALGFGNKPSAVVIRRGASGCLIASHNRFVSFPAYHKPPTDGTPEEVTAWHANRTATWDVTGGGNAFLGGFCVGLLSRPNDQIDDIGFTEFERAAIYGSVAASFAIEQVGMPTLSYTRDGKELWNGDVLTTDFDLFVNQLDIERTLLTSIWRVAVKRRLEKMQQICVSFAPPTKLSEERIRKASLFEESMILGASGPRPIVRFFTRKGNNDYLRQGGMIVAADSKMRAAIASDEWMV